MQWHRTCLRPQAPVGPTDRAAGVELVINRARKQGTARKDRRKVQAGQQTTGCGEAESNLPGLRERC